MDNLSPNILEYTKQAALLISRHGLKSSPEKAIARGDNPEIVDAYVNQLDEAELEYVYDRLNDGIDKSSVRMVLLWKNYRRETDMSKRKDILIRLMYNSLRIADRLGKLDGLKAEAGIISNHYGRVLPKPVA